MYIYICIYIYIYIYTGCGIKNNPVVKLRFVSAKYSVEHILPHLINDCKKLLPDHFILQQDGAPAHTAKLNSPDLNPLDYHVRDATLEQYQRYSPKQKTIEELKDILKTIWKNCPRNKLTNQSSHSQRVFVRVFEKNGGHFEPFV